MEIQQRIDEVEQRIQEACKRSGRAREEINVIAVTKYATEQVTEQVMQMGIEHIGESRWQDAREKWTSLGSHGTWHFIGHLQTNKVKDVINKFKYIHSLDRMSLAKALEKRAAALNIEVACFIQVNVSGEASKYGCDPDELMNFAKQIKDFKHLHIVGLMTMAPYEAEETTIRQIFRDLRGLRDKLNEQRILPNELRHLSMGMSNDFEIAIEEGATWIRLGTVLVG